MSFHFFPYLPRTLSIFSLPAFEDHFLLHLFLGLPLLLVPSSSWVKIFLGILSSSILSRWPNQLILYPFIHFTVLSPLLISSSSRFARLFHSPFSYLGPYIFLNIFLSKISRACSSFFVNVHAFAPYDILTNIHQHYNCLFIKELNTIIFSVRLTQVHCENFRRLADCGKTLVLRVGGASTCSWVSRADTRHERKSCCSLNAHTSCEAHQTLLRGQDVKLTTDIHPMPSWGMSGAILSPPYVYVACTCTLYFYRKN